MCARIDIGSQGFIYPMPMTLIGADLPSGPGFAAIAWVTRIEPNPPRLLVAMNKAHATNAGIREHGEFSGNIPSVDMVAVTDWCGVNSAARGVDKAAPFEIVRGSLRHAPMIAECPLSMECHVVQTVEIDSHELFIADIVSTWADQRCLDGTRKPDIAKMRPFVLTMPDNRYWAVGKQVGDAWRDGRTYQPPARGGDGRP